MQQNIVTINPLFDNIASLIEQAKQYVVTTVNTTIEDVHFEIGRIADKEKIQEPSILKEVERLEKIAEKITKNNQDPYILEFLGLEEETKYSEEQLETRILDHLQQFLLELGKGFTFVGRQVRFTFEEEHFRVDLVFYNRLLRSFVVIDLKLSKLSHKDLGQMQMYVNYYDRKVKLEDENPTIGILLCQSKNDAVVEMTLPKDANIFASAYSLYLPDKKLLQEKLAEWIAEFEE
jgi:predicted nuclease of restriction endonuclease-like (RecB) superfamily